MRAQVSFPSKFASVFSAIKQNSPILFLAQILRTLFKRSPLKCKFLRFLSIRVKIREIPQYLTIILKTSVRFTLKQLRYESSSSFDIILGCEEGGILSLQIAVMFGMKKKTKNEIKRKHRYRNFFTNKKKKDYSTI